MRLGELSSHSSYNLTPQATKDLFLRKRTLDEITEKDFVFVSQQKGVDMRIGVDIASMAYKKQVNQIILIAGDSDFVPAAKLARREGIDSVSYTPLDVYKRQGQRGGCCQNLFKVHSACPPYCFSTPQAVSRWVFFFAFLLLQKGNNRTFY